MSEVILLITPTVVKERTGLHSNVDDKLIVPEIKAAQDMRVRPLLGSVLFDKLLTDIKNTTLTGKYLDLMNNYIVDIVCNYVLSELPEGLNYQFYNKGLSTKTQEGSEVPNMSDMYAIVSKYKKRAEHYSQTCRLHIMQNIIFFPEYYAPGGIDVIQPERSAYTSPIYLGDQYGFIKPNASFNEPLYPYLNDT